MLSSDHMTYNFGANSRVISYHFEIWESVEEMVRTRAENTGRRAVGAKAPRKQVGCSSSNSVLGSPGAKDKHSVGNPVRWTTTPSWQKGIGSFFEKPEVDQEDSTAGENSSSAGDENMTNGGSPTSNHTSSSSEKACPSNIEEITQAE